MRPFIAISLILLTAPATMAQQAPVQQPYPQQMVDAYGTAYAVPQPPMQYQPAQPVQPAAPVQQYQQPKPQPGDYGYSVTNDIRQMNF